MIWANFLHIYQPANQIEEIFKKVVGESYRPLVQALLDNPTAKLTLNISGALTERLANSGYEDIVLGLRELLERGQVEFTDSAKYHAFLPLLPEEEIIRQITLNRETNVKYLGPKYAPTGFFPPEMGYDPKLTPILEKMGYQWLIIDEIAYNGRLDKVKNNVLYKIPDSKLAVFFRERQPSNLIMSAVVRRKEDFVYEGKGYMVTGMDGETFGHHRPGLQSFLTELLTSPDFEHAHFGELMTKNFETEMVKPVASTWASSEQDIALGVQFASWKDPKNEIHKLQWQLQELALETVVSREKLDVGLASDQFFWASGKPWWSLEVIELGAWTLLEATGQDPKAKDLYLAILAQAFSWQRTGKVREMARQMKGEQKISFKERTTGAGEPWVYRAFMDLLNQEMKKAANKQDYEAAILWRDAMWKLETKNDIFDAVHVVDLLRKQISNKEVEDLILKYKAEYKKIVSGQPEQRV